MKYFAIRNKDVSEAIKYLQSVGYISDPMIFTSGAVLMHNTLDDIDFITLRLKYDIVMPTQAELQYLESIYKISLNMDEYPA